jgi:methyl-accepting chemotaxis protein
MNFNNLKIGHRLGLGFGAVLLLLLVLTGVAFNGMNAASRGQQQLVEMERRAMLADEWVASTQLNINRVMALAKSGNNPEVEAYFKPLIAQTTERINVLQKDLDGVIDSEQGKALMTDIGARRKEYIAVRKAYFDALKAADPQATQLLDTQLLPAAQRYVSTMQELQKHEHALVDEKLRQAEAINTRQDGVDRRHRAGGIAGGGAGGLARGALGHGARGRRGARRPVGGRR